MEESKYDYFENIMEDESQIFNKFKQAHDEVGDVIMGVECQFDIYCKRRSSPDCIYKTPAFIKRTPKGWWVNYFELSCETDRECSALLHMIESQSVCIPKSLGIAFENLWIQTEEVMGVEEFKIKIKHLSDWVEETDNSRPNWF